MTPKPIILLTNDDGYRSEGLWALERELASLGTVIVVAPDRERSAVSHSVTINRPLRVINHNGHGNDQSTTYTVDGTPADCIKIGLAHILSSPPALVVSGINRGANSGINILYSGTVAGAAEGAISGIPSMAVSLASFSWPDFHPAAVVGRRIAGQILSSGLPPGVLLNVNVPKGPLKNLTSFRITRQGKHSYRDFYLERFDPRNQPYLWLQAEKISLEEDEDSDVATLRQGLISITPLSIDRTAHGSRPFCHELVNSLNREDREHS